MFYRWPSFKYSCISQPHTKFLMALRRVRGLGETLNMLRKGVAAGNSQWVNIIHTTSKVLCNFSPFFFFGTSGSAWLIFTKNTGHYITNPNKALFFGGNPSKWPTFAWFDSPKKMVISQSARKRLSCASRWFQEGIPWETIRLGSGWWVHRPLGSSKYW